jgi:nucleoside-diphosphate kinase
MVIEGPNAVECVRQTAGIEAIDIGSLRGDYSGFVTRGCLKKNLIHTSDSVENAKVEINRFLDTKDIFEWDSVMWPEMFSPKEWEGLATRN